MNAASFACWIARKTRADTVVRESAWRRGRLLVLCWHGIAVDDEHLWRPGLYISKELFRERIRMLAEGGYRVLTLDEGLQRLWKRDLPPRSVVITFDDGCANFVSLAAPVLQEYNVPATVYLTTYYVDDQKPIFDQMAAYLLWKCRGPRRHLRDGTPVTNISEATRAAERLIARADQDRASADDKDGILRALASELESDYDRILGRRMLHLMTVEEARRLSETGTITIEAHTHRHRTPVELEQMRRELWDNSARIAQITGRTPKHFCYPSGVVRHEYFPLFEESGFRSATTCSPNLASINDHRYLIPRFLDHAAITDRQYDAWLAGLYGLRRTIARRS